ncbi:hypothetical protein XbC2_5 [Xanthomonas phage XbC2]|nr:hypothetical protein XbC2_5 [Xanthomonas phage XbC2]
MTRTVFRTVKLEDVKGVTITANRWFNRGDGNTYHSVYLGVLIPVERANELGANLYKRPISDGTVWIDLAQETFEYGYERCYDQTALALFDAGCSDTIADTGTLSRFCRESGIEFAENVHDVKRKKDL